MPNVNAPFGFSQYSGAGSVPTYEMTVRRINPNDNTPCFYGDPVKPLNTGYVTKATVGTEVIQGIFVGCHYFSTSMQQPVWRRYWPGNDATGEVMVYLITDPNAQFLVQAGDVTVGLGAVGDYIQFNPGVGNVKTGQSGAFVEDPGPTVTLPFIVRQLVRDPPGSPGTDSTSPYNRVIVGFNNQAFRTNGAGPVGIG
jgi:hypothetical protein